MAGPWSIDLRLLESTFRIDKTAYTRCLEDKSNPLSDKLYPQNELQKLCDMLKITKMFIARTKTVVFSFFRRPDLV